MWLVYLRFDGDGQTRVGHVPASNKKEAEQVVERARKMGASFPNSRLTECQFFYAHATIHKKPSPEIIFDESE
jgi:hypothetical protein